MKYQVHKFEIDMEKDQMELQEYINTLRGEVVSVFPNIRNSLLGQIYGISRKIDFVFIIEKLPE